MNNEENNNVVQNAVPEIPEINASPIAAAPEATQPAPVEPAQVINEPVVVPSANDISPASPEVPTTPAQTARVDSNMIAANNVVNPNTMMTPVEPSDPNPQPEKKNKKGSPIILLLLLVVLAAGGYYAYNTFLAGNTKEEKNTKTEKTTKEKEEEEDSETAAFKKMKNRATAFIEAAVYSQNVGLDNQPSGKLIQGYNKPLTKYDKIKITLAKIVYVDKSFKKADSVPEALKGSFTEEQNDFYAVTSAEFKKAYKEIFGVEFTDQLTDLQDKNVGSQTCPYVLGIDNETIYLVSGKGQCDHSVESYYTKFINETVDDSYYTVYQYVGISSPKSMYGATGEGSTDLVFSNVNNDIIDVNKFEDNEDKFTKLAWKFDKEGNFVSSEQITV